MSCGAGLGGDRGSERARRRARRPARSVGGRYARLWRAAGRRSRRSRQHPAGPHRIALPDRLAGSHRTTARLTGTDMIAKTSLALATILAVSAAPALARPGGKIGRAHV